LYLFKYSISQALDIFYLLICAVYCWWNSRTIYWMTRPEIIFPPKPVYYVIFAFRFALKTFQYFSIFQTAFANWRSWRCCTCTRTAWRSSPTAWSSWTVWRNFRCAKTRWSLDSFGKWTSRLPHSLSWQPGSSRVTGFLTRRTIYLEVW
jgi:hypothetical protein